MIDLILDHGFVVVHRILLERFEFVYIGALLPFELIAP
jgi:hypothetical protein